MNTEIEKILDWMEVTRAKNLVLHSQLFNLKGRHEKGVAAKLEHNSMLMTQASEMIAGALKKELP